MKCGPHREKKGNNDNGQKTVSWMGSGHNTLGVFTDDS